MTAVRSALGVDLGGTKIAVAAVTEAGTIVHEARASTQADSGPATVVDRIAATVRQVLEGLGPKARPVEPIGVGVPGQLDSDRHVVLSAPNLPGWSDFALAEALSQRLDGRPILLENDANLAALAEHAFGAGRHAEDLILLTLGTGVGGGLVLNGRLVRGAHGWAGELGHLILDPEGPACGMGHRGCLESLASGTAIARDARARLRGQGMERLRALVDADPERVTAELVEQAARDGDPGCQELFVMAGRHLGIGIASYVLAFDPAVVVVGGSVVRAGALLLDPLRETARAALFPAGAEALRIVTTELGGRAGVLGAALLALREERSS